jgi:hypothetical protein
MEAARSVFLEFCLIATRPGEIPEPKRTVALGGRIMTPLPALQRSFVNPKDRKWRSALDAEGQCRPWSRYLISDRDREAKHVTSLNTVQKNLDDLKTFLNIVQPAPMPQIIPNPLLRR